MLPHLPAQLLKSGRLFWPAPSTSASGPTARSSSMLRKTFESEIDLIQIGDGNIERVHVAEPFFERSVVSMSDLLRSRAVTVVDRGVDNEVEEFRWLLSGVRREGQVLPGLDQDELEYMRRAGESCLGRLDRLVLGAISGSYNYTLAHQFLFS